MSRVMETTSHAEHPRVFVAKILRREPSAIWLASDSHAISVYGSVVNLTRTEWLCAMTVIAAYPSYMLLTEMHEHVYGLREDGGPDIDALRMHLWRVKTKLAHTRCSIQSRYSRGWTCEFLPPIAEPLARAA